MFLCLCVCVFVCECICAAVLIKSPNVFIIIFWNQNRMCFCWQYVACGACFDSSSSPTISLSLSFVWQTNVKTKTVPNGKQKPFRNSLFRYFIYAFNANFFRFFCFSSSLSCDILPCHSDWIKFIYTIHGAYIIVAFLNIFMLYQNNLRMNTSLLRHGEIFSTQYSTAPTELAYVLLSLSQH